MRVPAALYTMPTVPGGPEVCGTTCCIIGVAAAAAGSALRGHSDLAWEARQYLRLEPRQMDALACPWQTDSIGVSGEGADAVQAC